MTLVYLACMGVGLIIGWTGIAGFLLPPLFMSALDCPTTEALFLSFSCFLVSGIIGSVNYAKRGEIERKMAKPLCLSSLLGATCGAVIGGMLSQTLAKTLLYLVVFLSGLSCLVREFIPHQGTKNEILGQAASMALGFATALVCSLSGAGGPVLVMPLLVALGLGARCAVGLALFDSIFIAIPAILVYGARSMRPALLPVLILSMSSHAIGVELGSRSAHIVPQTLLKRAVAIFSLVFATIKLISLHS